MNTITNQILEDIETLPSHLQEETLDFVRFLKSKLQSEQSHSANEAKEPNGVEIARLMAKISERGTAFLEIEDPAKWQQEIRKDSPLPGREE